MALEDEMQIITGYVEQYRRDYAITPTFGVKPEFSCFAFGEGYNLLYTQLIPTVTGSGYWQQVEKDPEILKLVLEQIEKDQSK